MPCFFSIPEEITSDSRSDSTWALQYKKIADSVQTSLELSTLIKETEVVEKDGTCSVIAWVNPDQKQKSLRKQILDIAKSALLSVVEKYDDVSVLGHQAKPFSNTPFGFSATLGAMPDRSVGFEVGVKVLREPMD
jgi:hypothetical protein